METGAKNMAPTYSNTTKRKSPENRFLLPIQPPRPRQNRTILWNEDLQNLSEGQGWPRIGLNPTSQQRGVRGDKMATGANSDPTQCKQILEYIEEYGSINPMQALSDLGIMRLASRISELNKAGYNIKSRITPFVTRLGRKSNYAQYSMEETCQLTLPL